MEIEVEIGSIEALNRGKHVGELLVSGKEGSILRVKAIITLHYASNCPVLRPFPREIVLNPHSARLIRTSDLFHGANLSLFLVSSCPSITFVPPFSVLHSYPNPCIGINTKFLSVQLKIVVCSRVKYLIFAYFDCSFFTCEVKKQIKITHTEDGELFGFAKVLFTVK
jgi:hypothetical protein